MMPTEFLRKRLLFNNTFRTILHSTITATEKIETITIYQNKDNPEEKKHVMNSKQQKFRAGKLSYNAENTKNRETLTISGYSAC